MKKRKFLKRNADRHAGLMLLRESEYPMAFTINGATVYLNPMKKMIKGEQYKNLAYQDELNRMLTKFMEHQKAILKQQREGVE